MQLLVPLKGLGHERYAIGTVCVLIYKNVNQRQGESVSKKKEDNPKPIPSSAFDV